MQASVLRALVPGHPYVAPTDKPPLTAAGRMNKPAEQSLDPIARQRLKTIAAAGTLSNVAPPHRVEPQAAADLYPVQPTREVEVRPKPALTSPVANGVGVGRHDGERRVSLAGLFGLVTLAGAVLAMRTWLAPPAFAGIAGMLVLGYLFLRSLLCLRDAVYTLGAWMLVLIYVAAVAMALSPLL